MVTPFAPRLTADQRDMAAHYWPRVRRLARVVTCRHSWLRAFTEDEVDSFAAEALLHAVRNWWPGRWRSVEAFICKRVAYLIWCAGVRALFPHGRSRLRLIRLEAWQEPTAPPTPDPLVRADDIAALKWALGQLDLWHAKLLDLLYWEELPLNLAARRLGINRVEARKAEKHALRCLRALLNGETPPPAESAAEKAEKRELLRRLRTCCVDRGMCGRWLQDECLLPIVEVVYACRSARAHELLEKAAD